MIMTQTLSSQFTFSVGLAGVAGQEKEDHESSHLPPVTITCSNDGGGGGMIVPTTQLKQILLVCSLKKVPVLVPTTTAVQCPE